jgi:hypothetical protein
VLKESLPVCQVLSGQTVAEHRSSSSIERWEGAAQQINEHLADNPAKHAGALVIFQSPWVAPLTPLLHRRLADMLHSQPGNARCSCCRCFLLSPCVGASTLFMTSYVFCACGDGFEAATAPLFHCAVLLLRGLGLLVHPQAPPATHTHTHLAHTHTHTHTPPTQGICSGCQWMSVQQPACGLG